LTINGFQAPPLPLPFYPTSGPADKKTQVLPPLLPTGSSEHASLGSQAQEPSLQLYSPITIEAKPGSFPYTLKPFLELLKGLSPLIVTSGVQGANVVKLQTKIHIPLACVIRVLIPFMRALPL
jgi:hypothetical protein